MDYKGYYSSPIGTICIQAIDKGITNIDFINDNISDIKMNHTNSVIQQCIIELEEYFSGIRKIFDVELIINGTEFRKKIWNELLKIPYGTTKSYKDIATLVGNPNAVRAVGGANHNNKISVIIPCHRVIGANGSLTGYGGELWRKEWLLKHEGAIYESIKSIK